MGCRYRGERKRRTGKSRLRIGSDAQDFDKKEENEKQMKEYQSKLVLAMAHDLGRH